MTTLLNEPPPPDDWQPLPPGTFRDLARSGAAARRPVLLSAAVTISIAMAFVSGWSLWSVLAPSEFPLSSDKMYGGIRCSQVRAKAVSYRDGQLDDKVRDQIDAHLRLCVTCRNYVEAQRAAMQRGPTPVALLAKRTDQP